MITRPAVKPRFGSSRGFTLIETLISLMVAIVGLVAVAALVAYGIRLGVFSRDASLAGTLAKAKVEELRALDSSHPERAPGGDLASNVANHYDVPGGTGFIRRWTVASGPAGTQDVTVTVVASNPNVLLPAVQIRILLYD